MIRSNQTHGRVSMALPTFSDIDRIVRDTVKLVQNRCIQGPCVLGMVDTPKGIYLTCSHKRTDMSQRIQLDPASWVGNYDQTSPPEDVEADVLVAIRQITGVRRIAA